MSRKALARAALWACAAVAALSLYFYSQGRTVTGAPRSVTIETAVEEALKRQVPPAIAKTLYPCRATHVSRVTVLDVGSSAERGGAKAWPVRARVWGEMESFELLRRSVRDFHGDGVWIVSRDGLGTWTAAAAE